MAYTMEDFQKDYVKEHLGVLSPNDRIKGLSTDDLLRGLSLDDRLKGLSLEEIQRYLEKKKSKKSKEVLREDRRY